MVAITVILAAVIAAFVLDIGDLDDGAPNAQFEWEIDRDQVIATHTSGDDIDESNLKFQTDQTDGATITGGSPISAGDKITFDGPGSGDTGTAQVIWEANGSSTVIAEYDYDI